MTFRRQFKIKIKKNLYSGDSDSKIQLKFSKDWNCINGIHLFSDNSGIYMGVTNKRVLEI